MVLQSIFTAGVTDQGLQVPAFSLLIAAIVAGWLLVSVFQRVLENLAYETLGLNSRSTVHALIVAVLTSIIFISFIWMIDEYRIIPASAAGAAAAAATEDIASGSSSNTITRQIEGSTRFGHPIVLLPTGI